MKERKITLAVDLLATVVGTFLVSLSVYYFSAPNQIAPGGVTGISTILHHLFDLPIGVVAMALNLPLFLLGLRYLGKLFMLKTAVSLVCFTVFTDYVLVYLPVYQGNKLLAAVFGGVLMGAGIGLALLRGASTGGMDIVNKLVSRRMPHLKLGRITFFTDMIVVLSSAVAFGSVDTALYAIVSLYISSLALDGVLYGLHLCKFIYIITEEADAVCDGIISQLHRSATLLRSYGAYTKKEKPTVMVAVRQNEYYTLKKLVYSIDPNAFMIVTAASDVMGVGFENPKES